MHELETNRLSEKAHEYRHRLVIISSVTIVLVEAGAIPKKIAIFGIEFDSIQQDTLRLSLFFTVLYMLIAFAIEAWTDHLKFKLKLLESKKFELDTISEKIKIAPTPPSPIRQAVRERYLRRYLRDAPFYVMASRPTLIARILIDTIFPLGIGLIALYTSL
jgi:hypothetical protein